MRKSSATIEILIAEDSATQAAKLAHILEQRGYSVLTARNGHEALAALERSRAHLVISDVIMPELDGYGLCKAIRSDPRWKDLPVVLLTTLSDAHDVIRGLECGADNFIRKPYEEKYLLSRIEYVLMNRELRKNQKMQMGVEIELGGQKHFITSERQQILDLLISTYEQAVLIGNELKLRERELAHSNEVLSRLNGIAEGLNRVGGVREVAELALERAVELPGVQAGWIFLREGEDGFRLVAARNLPQSLQAPGAMEGDCACRRRLLSGALDGVTNILECERLQNAQGDTRGLLYHASVPLWLGDRTLGVMNLVGPEEGMFEEDDLTVLYGVGNQVAVALERARLHENLEKLVEERTAHLEAEITRRVEAERHLSESEERYRMMFDRNPHPIWVYDSETLRFLAVNEAALELYGYSRDEFLRLTIKDIRPPSEVPALLRSLAENSREAGSRVFGVFNHRKKDGTPIEVEVASSGVVFSGREARLVLAMDVTERRRLEEEHRRMERQLEQARRVDSLGRVAATMAHELNNVLMGIQPFAELISRQAGDHEGISKAAKQISSSVRRGKRVTEEILRFTKAVAPSLQVIDMGEWVTALEPELRAVAGSGVELRIVPSPRKTFTFCDPAQMQQVIANLVINARDAMQSGGVITLSATIVNVPDATAPAGASQAQRFIRLTVRDQGSGIAPEAIEQIFEPLFTTKRSGTGLGLAVARQIVSQHRGLIFAENAPGGGTEFHVLLPEVDPSSATVTTPAKSTTLIRRLLLVEDDSGIAAGIKSLLQLAQVTVHVVDRGSKVISAIEQFSPQAVVLDLALPDIDGREVFRQIVSRWPDLPVVFSTGHGSEAELADELARPHVGLLRKPYEVDALISEIERAL